jgi:hypothetical protein
LDIISILEELERTGDILFGSVLSDSGKSLLDAVIEQHGRRFPRLKIAKNLHWVETKA